MDLERDYLKSPINLTRGSTDDDGDARYVRLAQNVPDGFVTELQEDLRSLGFGEGDAPDGAFGGATKEAVMEFQEAAGLDGPYDGIVGPATKEALREWLTKSNTQSSPAKEETPAPSGDNRLITPRVPHFSQGDPRWADRVLGRSSSIARKGCAISCIAMTLRFYGRTIDPALLDAHLDLHDGYAGDSVKWGAVISYDSGTGPKLRYDRQTGSSEELVSIVGDRIERNLPTMIRVDYGSDANLTYNHFVLGVGLTRESQIIMNDPATRRGDGYDDPSNDNILQRTGRKQGYAPVQLDWYEPVG